MIILAEMKKQKHTLAHTYLMLTQLMVLSDE